MHKFHIGNRVQVHPATDAWMRGNKYGSVLSIGRKYITVLMDRDKRRLKFTRDLLLPAE